jgi:hypothetical protein
MAATMSTIAPMTRVFPAGRNDRELPPARRKASGRKKEGRARIQSTRALGVATDVASWLFCERSYFIGK